MSADIQTLEAVYYPCPLPTDAACLTYLGLVFDKIHFPNVYLPADGYDEKAVASEVRRIEAFGFQDYETHVLLAVLKFLPIANQLREFCYFTGVNGQVFGDVDKGAETIVGALYDQMFGAPKENFIPIHQTGFHKGLPNCDAYIDYPGSLHYPANALIYAARHEIPLINNVIDLPVPALGGDVNAKNNAKLLATILAMQCASVVLPKLRTLTPVELLEARAELNKYVRPFRLSLLRLSAKLNAAISQSSNIAEIMDAAKFVVESEVVPSLAELKDAIERPGKRWYGRAFDTVKQVPALVTSFATMPANIVIAQALAAIGGIFVDLQAENAKKDTSRSGMYYLLKLQERNAE